MLLSIRDRVTAMLGRVFRGNLTLCFGGFSFLFVL